ncbi:MAG TPA: methyltransferase domain-containing protein [Vicinamibacterales bacterium]|nr:methyltransferase domain-containing protein [Vicinamibacterales bacterium]
MDFKHTRISLKRPLTDYTKVRHLVAALLRNRAAHINRARIEGRRYLNIGCGPNVVDHCINLDYEWHPRIDICWDVTRGIPLQSGAVTGIYSEHCFEHLPVESMGLVLGECYRVLAPGGHVRIVMPDGELYLTRYADIARGVPTTPLPYSENHSIDGIRSPIVTVNRIFRHHGHQFIHDFDFLRQLLEQAGFTDIAKTSCGVGRDPLLLLDSPHRAIESLYVEATRPAGS